MPILETPFRDWYKNCAKMMESIHVINERVEFCLGHVGGVETRSYLRSQTANSPPTLEGLAYAIVLLAR